MDILLLKSLSRIAIEAKGIDNIDIFRLIQVSNFIYSSILSRMSAISIVTHHSIQISAHS